LNKLFIFYIKGVGTKWQRQAEKESTCVFNFA